MVKHIPVILGFFPLAAEWSYLKLHLKDFKEFCWYLEKKYQHGKTIQKYRSRSVILNSTQGICNRATKDVLWDCDKLWAVKDEHFSAVHVLTFESLSI